MGRSLSSIDNVLKKGPWTEEEDQRLLNYIQQHGGHGRWRLLPKRAGLNRCGKSCRLRWTNYLRPDIKRGNFSQEEEETIINLHLAIGNKWSQIAAHLPGRTDNEIKNYWNTNIKRKLTKCGIDPKTHQPICNLNFLVNLSHLISLSTSNLINMMSPMLYTTNTQVFQNLSQFTNTANYSLPQIGETSLSQCHGLMNGTRGPLYAMNDIYQEPSNMAISSQIHDDNVAVGASTTRCEARVNHDNIFLDLVPTFSENALINEMLKESYPTYIPADTKRTTYNNLETFKKLMDDFEDDVSFWKDILN